MGWRHKQGHYSQQTHLLHDHRFPDRLKYLRMPFLRLCTFSPLWLEKEMWRIIILHKKTNFKCYFILTINRYYFLNINQKIVCFLSLFLFWISSGTCHDNVRKWHLQSVEGWFSLPWLIINLKISFNVGCCNSSVVIILRIINHLIMLTLLVISNKNDWNTSVL